MNFKILCLIFLCIIEYIFALSCVGCDKARCKKVECCASGELTLDICRCCPVCAKTDQEPCGGPWGGAGKCASGLNCLKKFECKTQKGENCIFPFNYRGKKYNNCTSDYLKKGTGRWCATGVHGNGNMIKSKWGYCNPGSCPGGDINVIIKWEFMKGICVNKKQIEDQLKANKSIIYNFDDYSRSSQNNRKKIKSCNSGCDFKEGMKDLKQEMTKMKRELIMAIHAQKSKNCGPYQNDWSELVYCNDDADCREKFGNTLTQCFEAGIKNGICTPVFCQDNNECPKVGDWLTSGALTGSCDTNSNHCNYHPALIIS